MSFVRGCETQICPSVRNLGVDERFRHNFRANRKLYLLIYMLVCELAKSLGLGVGKP